MKMIVFVALALVALAAAADIPRPVPVPRPAEEQIAIIRSDFVHEPEGGYNFDFESANGVVRSEVGQLKEVLDEDNKPRQVVVVRGSYGYADEEGPVEISYYADETGYHAEGQRIPQA